jgi:hypothetical protein
VEQMSDRLTQAMKLVVEEQEEIKKTVENQGKIIESQGLAIASLEKKVQELRDCAIKAEIANGVPTKTVASKYQITSSRVSQIAPRNRIN